MTLSVVPTSKISRLNSSMSRSDVANLAVVPSFDMTRLECDGSLVKRGAFFASETYPHSGSEQFHEKYQAALSFLKGKLTELFISCVQFYEQVQLRNLARIEHYLTHWLSWAKGAGIAQADSLLFGIGNSLTTKENMQ